MNDTSANETSANETARLDKARNLISLCVKTPGAFSAITKVRDAILIWAATMRSDRYPEVRARLLAFGQLEHDITYVEKEALKAAVAAGHPLPGQKRIP